MGEIVTFRLANPVIEATLLYLHGLHYYFSLFAVKIVVSE